MTLEEAIQHCRDKAFYQRAIECFECAEEHEQLADWLTELKERREKQGEWIPVSERLPDGSGEVLVTADYHGTLVVYSAWYNEM